MAPPRPKDMKAWNQYCANAPISQWFVFKKYETYKECIQERNALRDRLTKQVNDHKMDQLEALPLQSSRCVAYDDPRLANP